MEGLAPYGLTIRQEIVGYSPNDIGVSSAGAAILTDRLSIVVGVTGHRDTAADDEPRLRAAFGRILQELLRSHPHTPLLVLSGLAAGADSLAAEEAMARNIPVLACLPMPVEEYEKDFSAPELARFRTLLAAAARVTVTSPTRENGYAAVGRFIAQYSHLLVAFWDGQMSRGLGGTADVVEMRLTGSTRTADIESIPYLPDMGPVDQIVTPHASAPSQSEPFHVRRLYPQWYAQERDGRQPFLRMLAAIDSYNADLARTPIPAQDVGLQALMERTDAAANRLQKRTAVIQTSLLLVAFVVAGFQIITQLPSIIKIVGLAVAFGIYWWARKHDYENRYQDYRAIAEGLRVQNAWHCAGLRHKLADNAYLKMQEGELQWIRMALRFFYLVLCEGREFADASHQHPVCEDWVQSQRRYYERASRREAAVKMRLDRITLVAAIVGLLCMAASLAELIRYNAVCVLVGSCQASHAAPENLAFLSELFSVPLAMAAVLGAVFAHYIEKQNLVANARRYERMYRVFDRAHAELVRINQGAQGNPKSVIYELGHAALVEHAEWLIMRRDRPMTVVVV